MAITEYLEWRRAHGDEPVIPVNREFEVAAIRRPDASAPLRRTSLGKVLDVWAFFTNDARPLSGDEVAEAIRLLG